MKNSEIKWNQREICEVLDNKIVTFHASFETARRDKTPETRIISMPKEDALKMPLLELEEMEVCYE
jgi:hypothetical protein